MSSPALPRVPTLTWCAVALLFGRGVAQPSATNVNQ
jgi:hypothetical protein